MGMCVWKYRRANGRLSRRVGRKSLDKANGTISQTMSYPDPTKDKTGFNPINYPDLKFTYKVNVTALSGSQFKISVDLEQPLPAQWVGRWDLIWNYSPVNYLAKPFNGSTSGYFPAPNNGPIESHHGEFLAAPLAVGKTLTIAPDDDARRITINNSRGNLELWDGRSNHNNGWYIVRSSIPANATKKCH